MSGFEGMVVGGIYELNKLAAYDIFNQVHCFWIGVLYLPEDKHLLRYAQTPRKICGQGRTICDISWVYL
jgi:hypothetical protein